MTATGALRVRAHALASRLVLPLIGVARPAAAAADDGIVEWLPWVVLGAVTVFVAGMALRMFIAARFPKGYGAWARRRRGEFAERNEQWDRADDEFRK